MRRLMVAVMFSLSVDNDTAAPILFGNRLFGVMNMICLDACAPQLHTNGSADPLTCCAAGSKT